MQQIGRDSKRLSTVVELVKKKMPTPPRSWVPCPHSTYTDGDNVRTLFPAMHVINAMYNVQGPLLITFLCLLLSNTHKVSPLLVFTVTWFECGKEMDIDKLATLVYRGV